MSTNLPVPLAERCDGTDATPGEDSIALRRRLREIVARYRRPSLTRSLGQLGSTVLPFLALNALMYVSLSISYWLTLALAIPTAGFVVRMFIIQHDCGHGSFFGSRHLNDIVGRLCSMITFAPYGHWRRQHAGHHGVWCNLDRRDYGTDIYSSCLTVAEYAALPLWRRCLHRFALHPLVANLLLPPIVFLIVYRVPFDTPRHWWREHVSVHITNFALAGLVVVGGLVLGFGAVAAVQLPIIVTAAIVGVWLFSVQHRFETTHWSRQETWDAVTAALHGSSYLKLPRLLHWFTGNIGYHHVHHLDPRIPNYRLRDCHQALTEVLGPPPALTLGRALLAFRCALWDEDHRRMVPFPAR
jgi:acyl-lipid omega-6 desaturase (Delta-12 desaturase)